MIHPGGPVAGCNEPASAVGAPVLCLERSDQKKRAQVWAVPLAASAKEFASALSVSARGEWSRLTSAHCDTLSRWRLEALKCLQQLSVLALSGTPRPLTSWNTLQGLGKLHSKCSAVYDCNLKNLCFGLSAVCFTFDPVCSTFGGAEMPVLIFICDMVWAWICFCFDPFIFFQLKRLSCCVVESRSENIEVP